MPKGSLPRRESTLHAVWDSGIIQLGSGLDYRGWREYADRLDTWDEAAIASVTSVAGGLYAIWQNLFNSWELYHESHSKPAAPR